MQTQREDRTEDDRPAPVIAAALNIVGALDILGGIILFFVSLPGSARPGYSWLFSAYVPSTIWLSAGIVSGLLMIAAASALTYLNEIRQDSATSIRILDHLSLVTRGGGVEAASEANAGSSGLDSNLRLSALRNLLNGTIMLTSAVDWSYHERQFSEPRPRNPSLIPVPPRPIRLTDLPKPRRSADKYQPDATFRDIWHSKEWRGKKEVKRREYEKDRTAWQVNKDAVKGYAETLSQWEMRLDEVEASNAKTLEKHAHAASDWDSQACEFGSSEEQRVGLLKRAYEKGEQEGVQALLGAALQPKDFPPGFCLRINFVYEELTRTLRVDTHTASARAVGLPSFGSDLYKSAVYQLCLAVIYKVLKADSARVIESIRIVISSTYVNIATGLETEIPLIEVCEECSALSKLDMPRVDPEACLRALGARIDFPEDKAS